MSNKEIEIGLADIDIFNDLIDKDDSSINQSNSSQVSAAEDIEDHIQQIQKYLHLELEGIERLSPNKQNKSEHDIFRDWIKGNRLRINLYCSICLLCA